MVEGVLAWSAGAHPPVAQAARQLVVEDRDASHRAFLAKISCRGNIDIRLVIQHVRFVVLEYLGMREGQLAARQPRPGREAGSLAGLG